MYCVRLRSQLTYSVVVTQAPGGGGSGIGSNGVPLDTASIQALLSDPATVKSGTQPLATLMNTLTLNTYVHTLS